MREHLSGWLIISLAIIVQFLLEVTIGRVIVAPAILVPALVYLSLSHSNYWSIEAAFWSGFAIDLLLHQPIGVSSIAMLSGIALSRWILRVTTGALDMTFVINGFLASILSDLFFVFLAARPVGSGFGISTLLVVPRILFSLLLYLGIPMMFGRRSREFG
ncbi:MAG: hypothetical protein K8S62_04755 [Candidatus Sabulitectum sp.]|nr:hypothetical protein [Candidatus Sabulitectum sp.]